MTAALGPVGVPFQPDNLSLPGWLNIRHLERKEGPLLSQSIPVSPEPGELFVVRRCCQHCSNSMTLRLWAGGYLRVSTRAVWGKQWRPASWSARELKPGPQGVQETGMLDAPLEAIPLSLEALWTPPEIGSQPPV